MNLKSSPSNFFFFLFDLNLVLIFLYIFFRVSPDTSVAFLLSGFNNRNLPSVGFLIDEVDIS